MKNVYELQVAGLRRELPLCPLNDNLYIGAFVIFGDPELTNACAKELLENAPAYDYMTGVFEVTVHSITTQGEQKLYLDAADAAQMKGKRILLVDDVISTGESLRALEELVTAAGAEIAGRMCILAEGDAQKRQDMQYLAGLPLFDKNGDPIIE